MLSRLYVEALLADEGLADQVWELWNVGEITDHRIADPVSYMYGKKRPNEWRCGGNQAMKTRMQSRFISVLSTAAAVFVLMPQIAGAGAVMRWERAGCQGQWQLHTAHYTYTGKDRRNYYWIEVKTSSISWPSTFAGPFEVDDHCEPIGISNNYHWFAKGCLNNGLSCNQMKVTNTIIVPRQMCRDTQ